ncbi:MAG: KOW motif-containing protein, partial [Phycisphaeraceae bacterium]|nr:KOW motif-containing protein [Phycisphaeraceae bacterium]
TVKMEFEPGDHVKIQEGPFENMEGEVDELLPEQGKVRVIVTIFGRSTPIELEYWLVEPVEE